MSILCQKAFANLQHLLNMGLAPPPFTPLNNVLTTAISIRAGFPHQEMESYRGLLRIWWQREKRGKIGDEQRVGLQAVTFPRDFGK